jgi:hypothetical protein
MTPGSGNPCSDNLFGALIVTAALIALADVGRSTRFVNIFFGAWVIATPPASK